MWYTIYETDTGKYRGGSEVLDNIPDPLPEGLSKRTDPERMTRTHNWNPTTKDWDIKPPIRDISIPEFLERFTAGELGDLSDSDDPRCKKIVAKLTLWNRANKKINLDATKVVAMINILQSEDILTLERGDAILA